MKVLERAKRAVKKSGLTYREIGVRMGYPPESAKSSVGQFLNSTNPTVSMLLRFCKALGIRAKDLL
jgi:transcriptional regulator with XRE-family HTH domain